MSENETEKSHLFTQNDTRTTLQFARSALSKARESRATLAGSMQRVRTSPRGDLEGETSSSTAFDPSIVGFIGWPIESPEFTSLATRYLKEVVPAFCDWSKMEIENYGAIIQDLSAFMRSEAGIGKLAGAQTESEVEEITRSFLTCYNRLVEWIHMVMSTPVDLPMANMRSAMVPPAMTTLDDIEAFLMDIIQQVETVAALPYDQRPTVRVRLSIRNHVDFLQLDQEVKRLTEETRDVRDIISRVAAECEARQSLAGFLYLLVNPSMGDLVKVGKTKRNPKDRAKELGAVTGIPTPFILVFDVSVEDCDRAERYVHQRLAEYRVSSNREFFRVEPSLAIRIMLEAQDSASTA